MLPVRTEEMNTATSVRWFLKTRVSKNCGDNNYWMSYIIDCFSLRVLDMLLIFNYRALRRKFETQFQREKKLPQRTLQLKISLTSNVEKLHKFTGNLEWPLKSDSSFFLAWWVNQVIQRVYTWILIVWLLKLSVHFLIYFLKVIVTIREVNNIFQLFLWSLGLLFCYLVIEWILVLIYNSKH